MADSPVLYVYYRPDNDDAYPGVPNRHITEADWARFSPSQRRTVEQATTQEGYTRRKVWVHRDLVDETEQERADREAAEQAARDAYERGQSIVRWRDFEPLVPGPGEVIVGGADGPVAVPGPPDIRTPHQLRHFHRALANASTAPCNVFLLGDSVVEGADVSDFRQRWQALALKQLQQRFNPEGAPGGVGYVPMTKTHAYVTSGWPITAENGLAASGAVTTSQWGMQLRGTVFSAGTTSATVTWEGTSLAVLYRAVGTTSVPRLRVVIDGDAPIDVETPTAPPGAESDGKTWYSPVLSPGTHTAVITSLASLNIGGVMLFNGDETKGVRFWDSARSGATTTLFANPAAMWPQILPHIKPDLVLIGLGANDKGNDVGIATYRANMEALVQTFRANRTLPPSIVFLTHPHRPIPNEYMDEMKALAREDGDIAVFDVAERFGAAAEAAAAGLKGTESTVHMTALGARVYANALTSFLLP